MVVACQLWGGTLNRLTAHQHHQTPSFGYNSSTSTSTRRHHSGHYQQAVHPLAASGTAVSRCHKVTIRRVCVPSSSQHSSTNAPETSSTAVALDGGTREQHIIGNHHHRQQQQNNGTWLSDAPPNGDQQQQQQQPLCEPQLLHQLQQQHGMQPGQQVECQCQQQQRLEQPVQQQQQQQHGHGYVSELQSHGSNAQQQATVEEQLDAAQAQAYLQSSSSSSTQEPEQEQEQQSTRVQVHQANAQQQQADASQQQQPLSAQEHLQIPPIQKRHLKQQQEQQEKETNDPQPYLLTAPTWRHLLQPAAKIQALPQLVQLLRRALQLQPTAAAAAAVPTVAVAGLAASQPLYEQQQYSRFLRYVIARASQLLLPRAKAPKGAAAATAQRQDFLQLLQLLASIEPFLQQRLQQQLKQVPVAPVIRDQLRYWQPHVAVQVAVQLALLKPHMSPVPVDLQQLLLAAALGPASAASSGSSKQKASRAFKQQQQQQLPAVSAAAETLWAAARLGWEPMPQHLQRAVCAVLLQLPKCSSSQLAMAVWGAAHLGVTGRQLQQWWLAGSTAQEQTLQQQMRDLLRPEQQQEASARHIDPQQQQQQVSRVLLSALQRHCSNFSAPELVGVVWAAAELQLLRQSGLMRALLQAVCQPGVLTQLTDEDVSSVLWSLARMHQKRAAALRQERYWKQQRQEPQQQGERQQQEEEHGSQDQQQQQQQQQEQDLYDQGLAESLQVQLQQEGEGYQGWQLQQQWHAELDQHWYGANSTSEQQQKPGRAHLRAVDSTAQPQDHQQQQQQQHWKQQRRQQSATHARQLQQPDLVPPVLVQPLLLAYYTHLPTCSSSSIVRTLWSVSLLRVLPPREWMVGVLQQLQGHFAQLRGSHWVVDGTSYMLIALALSRLRYLPDGPWLKAFWLACLPFFPSHHQTQQQQQQQQQHGEAGQDAAVTLTSSSSSGSTSSFSSGGSGRGSGSCSRPFNEYELAVLASSAYDLSLLSRPNAKGPWKGQKPSGAWLDALAESSLGVLGPHLDLRTLLMWGEVMMRFSSMAGEPWPGPGAAWWQSFEAATEPYLQSADAKELLRLGKMLSTQQQHGLVGRGWVQAFLQASKACCLDTRAVTGVAGAQGWVRGQHGRRGSKTSPRTAPAAAAAAGGVQGRSGAVQSGPQALSARNLANLGKAVAAMGLLPDQQWLAAWEGAVELSGAGMTPALVQSLQRTRAAFDQLAER